MHDLLATIGYPGADRDRTPTSSPHLYRLARTNKIGSLYLHALEEQDAVGDLEQQQANRARFQEAIAEAARSIAADFPADLEYAVVKSTHGFPADSKDIDVILFEDDLERVRRHLVDAGYEFVGDSPTTFDVTPPGSDVHVDVQTAFSLQRVVYFDTETMRAGVTEREVGGARLPVAARPDDLALIVVHSITEQLFILKEFFAAIHALESFDDAELRRFFRTVERNHIEPACRAFFTVVDRLLAEYFDSRPALLDAVLDRYPPYGFERRTLVEEGLETPYRYTRRAGLRSVAGKLRNAAFVRSAIAQLPRMVDPGRLTHVGRELLARREREHYVHDTSDIEIGERA